MPNLKDIHNGAKVILSEDIDKAYALFHSI